jgi:hypothetical protein
LEISLTAVKARNPPQAKPLLDGFFSVSRFSEPTSTQVGTVLSDGSHDSKEILRYMGTQAAEAITRRLNKVSNEFISVFLVRDTLSD